MIDELKRLAGLVAGYPIEGAAKRNALTSLGRYTAKHHPAIIAALETAALVRDEDWLAGVMASEFPTWTKIKCKLSARAIIAALPKETDNAHN